jgi:flagellar biosynthesis protein FliR
MSKIDLKKLFDANYWLEGIAGSVSVTPVIEKGSFSYWFFIYLFSYFAIFGIILRVSQAFIHEQHPFQKHFPVWGNNFIWMGILGLVWFTARQLSIGFLGSRLWLIFGIFWVFILLYFIISYFIRFYNLEISYFRKVVLKKVS